jgi:hypothetical protein
MIVGDGFSASIVAEYLRQSQAQKQGLSVSDLPRPDGIDHLGQKIRLSKCYIVNAEGESSTHLRYGEPFSVYMEALANEKLSDLVFQLRIDSVTGDPVAQGRSSYSNTFFSSSGPQVIRVKALVENLVLFPGKYSLTISIHRLDQVVQAVDFDILPLPFDGRVTPHEGEWGYVRFVPRWNVLS